MKRELKGYLRCLPCCYHTRFKTDPDEKGTESIISPTENTEVAFVSRLIPMKRELKGRQKGFMTTKWNAFQD